MRCLLLILVLPTIVVATVKAGIGKADITPAIGTPSAGYSSAKDKGWKAFMIPFWLLRSSLIMEKKNCLL